VWLSCMTYAERRRGLVWPGIAGAALGIAVYTSNNAAVMMPVYAAVTVGVLMFVRPVPVRTIAAFAIAFGSVAIPFALFWLRHPDAFRQTVLAHHLYDANRFNVLQGAKEMASWVGLTARSEVYYDYFNPAFLFLNGNVLFPALFVLLPLGFYQMLTIDQTVASRIVLFGFLAAPFAGSLGAEPPQPARIVFITPFAAIVGAYGVGAIVSFWRRYHRSA